MRYLAKCEPENTRMWLHAAVTEAPGRREALVELARNAYETSDWELCKTKSEEALSIAEKPLDYLCEDFAWGWIPYDLAALACYNLRLKEEAQAYGEEALKLNPTDERLLNNMKYYKE